MTEVALCLCVVFLIIYAILVVLAAIVDWCDAPLFPEPEMPEDDSILVKVKAYDPTREVVWPSHGSEGAAGWDLYLSNPTTVWLDAGNKGFFDTNLCVEIPPGYVGIIKERSSSAAKKGLVCIAGVIDSDYRGEIKVGLLNVNSSYDACIEPFAKVAQLIILPVPDVKMEITQRLSLSERGKGGFGSTDNKSA